MSNPGDVTFTGSVAGATEEGGQIGPVDLSYALTGQAYTWEAKDFPVAGGTAIGGPGVVMTIPAIPGTLAQSLFIIKSDLPITFQLNGAGPTYAITKPDGPFVMAPGFDVTQIEFANGGTATAKVYVLQVVGQP